ncbi:IS110 family transposase [Enterocloster bolteae]|nr:IS110 family transposase [Enterocloster bolteae]MCQ5140940.1 IS110 family transposase [Enterocloster bolteae]
MKTRTALAVVVETDDFRRFSSAEKYACYLGLVPGELSCFIWGMMTGKLS